MLDVEGLKWQAGERPPRWWRLASGRWATLFEVRGNVLVLLLVPGTMWSADLSCGADRIGDIGDGPEEAVRALCRKLKQRPSEATEDVLAQIRAMPLPERGRRPWDLEPAQRDCDPAAFLHEMEGVLRSLVSQVRHTAFRKEDFLALLGDVDAVTQNLSLDLRQKLRELQGETE